MKNRILPIIGAASLMAIIATFNAPIFSTLKSFLRADDFTPIGGEIYQQSLSLDSADTTPTTENPVPVQAESRATESCTVLEDASTTVGDFEDGDWLEYTGMDMDDVYRMNLSLAKGGNVTPVEYD